MKRPLIVSWFRKDRRTEQNEQLQLNENLFGLRWMLSIYPKIDMVNCTNRTIERIQDCLCCVYVASHNIGHGL